jgi:hypothetical protein
MFFSTNNNCSLVRTNKATIAMMTDRINIDKAEFRKKSERERSEFLNDLQDLFDEGRVDFTLDGEEIDIDRLYDELEALNDQLNGQ